MSEPAALFATLVMTMALVLLAIGIHYELFRTLGRVLPRLGVQPRIKVALLIVSAIAAHVLEAVVFAGGTGVLISAGVGGVEGVAGSAQDLIYFSLSSYTTIGFGDVIGVGPIRILSGVEGIAGLVLIAWTASFAYVEMERYWVE